MTTVKEALQTAIEVLDKETHWLNREATDAIKLCKTALAELNAPHIQREGWISVPIEPTEEMIFGFWGEITHGQPEIEAAKEAYKAMLAAAPTETE